MTVRRDNWDGVTTNWRRWATTVRKLKIRYNAYVQIATNVVTVSLRDFCRDLFDGKILCSSLSPPVNEHAAM